MASIVRKVSDFTGVEGVDDDFIELTVRDSPWRNDPVKLDVRPEEIKGFKPAEQLVTLQYRLKKSDPVTTLVVTVTELKKHYPQIADVIATARSNRGRAPGFSPKSS